MTLTLYAHPVYQDCGNKNLGSIPFQPHVAAQQLLDRYTNTSIYYIIVWPLLPDFSDKAATESTDSIDASLVKESNVKILTQLQDFSIFFCLECPRLIYVLGHPTTLATGSDHQAVSPQINPIYSSEIMIHVGRPQEVIWAVIKTLALVIHWKKRGLYCPVI